MVTQEIKNSVIKDYQKHDTDTGSSDVQIAILTERINRLTDHLRANHKDFQCRRGLMQLVGRRRRLLRYVSQTDVPEYRALISRLGIRR